MINLKQYETLYLLRPDLTEEDRAGISEKLQKIITSHGGSVLKEDPWPLKKLAYKVNKQTQGYYVVMEYAAPPVAIPDLIREFCLDERVLKFNTNKLNETFTPEAKIEKEMEPSSPEMTEEKEEE